MIDLVKLKLELSTENPEVTNDPLGKLAARTRRSFETGSGLRKHPR